MHAHPENTPIPMLTAANFEEQVLRSPSPVLVAFGATWSKPCQIFNAALQEVASACAQSVKLFKVNADDNPDLSIWYEVQSIPALLFFVGGTLRAKLVGTATRDAILARLQMVLEGVNDHSANQTGHEQPHC